MYQFLMYLVKVKRPLEVSGGHQQSIKKANLISLALGNIIGGMLIPFSEFSIVIPCGGLTWVHFNLWNSQNILCDRSELSEVIWSTRYTHCQKPKYV